MLLLIAGGAWWKAAAPQSEPVVVVPTADENKLIAQRMRDLLVEHPSMAPEGFVPEPAVLLETGATAATGHQVHEGIYQLAMACVSNATLVFSVLVEPADVAIFSRPLSCEPFDGPPDRQPMIVVEDLVPIDRSTAEVTVRVTNQSGTPTIAGWRFTDQNTPAPLNTWEQSLRNLIPEEGEHTVRHVRLEAGEYDVHTLNLTAGMYRFVLSCVGNTWIEWSVNSPSLTDHLGVRTVCYGEDTFSTEFELVDDASVDFRLNTASVGVAEARWAVAVVEHR